MRRRIALAVFVAALALPGAANAMFDTGHCADLATATSAIEGYVGNVDGEAVVGAKVRIYATHFSSPASGEGTTDANGFYWICAPQHNTWVVEVQEQPVQRYGEVSRTVTTFANLDRIDFTKESGYPLPYLANLSVAPVGVSSLSSNAADRTWNFRFRTKAPTSSLGSVQISLDHDGSTTAMAYSGNVNGWNVYTKTATTPQFANDATYGANARGYNTLATAAITQLARTSYYVDGRKPDIGGAPCLGAPDDFIPASTTNPRPLISIGACDYNATKTATGSGLDGYTAMGKVCPTTSDCTPITSGSPVGNQCSWSISCQTFAPDLISSRFMQWTPSQPFALGTYYFRYSIRDRAGNYTETPTAYSFSVVETGGQPVYLGAITPSDGAAVIGCTCTTAASVPGVTFDINDNDGQADIATGSIKVQIRYMGEQTNELSNTPVGLLVYDYDPFAPPTALNGGTVASVDARRYKFIATGFRLQLSAQRLPGRYLVTASVSDAGGNSDSIGWLFYLVAAA